MKAAFDKETVKQGLASHAAVGLLAGALLYIVCLTGTLCVFYQEWQRVEQRGVPEMTAIAPDAVQRGVAAVLASEAGKPKTTHLYVHFPVEALPRTIITTDSQAVHIDASGQIAAKEENGWSEFLLALHYTLNIPSLVGVTLVGLLGVAILALSISGVIAHPRIFRDAFRLRMRDKGGVGLADWHNRLSVWTLPFSIAIALTGAMICLASLGAYGLATKYYGGNVEAAYAPIFGGEGKPDPKPADLPNITAAMRDFSARVTGVTPTYIILHDPLTRGQHIQIIAEHPRRLIYGENYNYDAGGRYVGKAGLSDGALGQQAAASTYNLHFGNFGGLTVKIAYAVMGLALTVITATGTYIWLGKRRRRGLDEPRLIAAWDGVIWGTPLALCICFLARVTMGNALPFAALFWGSATLFLLASILIGRRWPSKRIMQGMLVAGSLAGGVIAVV